MRCIVFCLACLVCTGQGRKAEVNADSRDMENAKPDPTSMKTLATFLEALHQEAGWQAASNSAAAQNGRALLSQRRHPNVAMKRGNRFEKKVETLPQYPGKEFNPRLMRKQGYKGRFVDWTNKADVYPVPEEELFPERLGSGFTTLNKEEWLDQDLYFKDSDARLKELNRKGFDYSFQRKWAGNDEGNLDKFADAPAILQFLYGPRVQGLVGIGLALTFVVAWIVFWYTTLVTPTDFEYGYSIVLDNPDKYDMSAFGLKY